MGRCLGARVMRSKRSLRSHFDGRDDSHLGRGALASLITLYALATAQLVWCYLWLVRPYVQAVQYEHGEERMRFQGRLMMLPMRWAHANAPLLWVSGWLSKYIYWFPRVVS